MGEISTKANQVYRDKDGSSPHYPEKPEIRQLFRLIDAGVTDVAAAIEAAQAADGDAAVAGGLAGQAAAEAVIDGKADVDGGNIPDKPAFRDSIDAVAKSGDAFTGPVEVPSLSSPTPSGYVSTTTPRIQQEQRFSNSVVSGVLPVAHFIGRSNATAGDSRLNTLVAFAYADAAWDGAGVNSFVEAGHLEAIGTANNTSLYGSVSIAGAPLGVAPKYIIGSEGVANATVDAPIPQSFNSASYSASFVSTSGLGKGADARKIDAHFVGNPFSEAPARTWGFIGAGSTDHTGLFNAANLASAFLDNSGAAVVGFSSGICSYAAIKMLNGASSVIRIKDGAGSADDNVFSYSKASGFDTLVLGLDSEAVDFPVGGTTRFKVTLVGPKYPAFTVSTLPSAADAGVQIYVSNESGGAQPAFSDGTNFRRYTDRAIVS